MELQDFKDALDDQGIDHRETGQSLVLKSCPACGSEKYKVHLRLQREDDRGLFLGRCYAGSCQTNFSSIKYLLMSGMGYAEVMQLHGQDSVAALKNMVPEIQNYGDVPEETEAASAPAAPTEIDIKNFFALKHWPAHPAAKYAIKRGAQLEWEFVMIDHESTAVVFVVYQNGIPIGYQRRFVHPDHPSLKTKTSKGFSKSEHILTFMREGRDIVVCEGPFTAIAAWHFGYCGVCTFGAGVSNQQIDQIIKLADQNKVNVGVAFDMDLAGLKGYNRIRAAMYWLEKKTFKLRPSQGNDLNDAWSEGGSAIVEEEKFEYSPALPELPRFI